MSIKLRSLDLSKVPDPGLRAVLSRAEANFKGIALSLGSVFSVDDKARPRIAASLVPRELKDDPTLIETFGYVGEVAAGEGGALWRKIRSTATNREWEVISPGTGSSGGVPITLGGIPVNVDLQGNLEGGSNKASRSDHRHILDEDIAPDWTNQHDWRPASDLVPVRWFGFSASQIANRFEAYDPDGITLRTLADKDYKWGFNDPTPTARVNIRAGAPTESDVVALSPFLWLRASDLGLANGSIINATWLDRTPNGRNIPDSTPSYFEDHPYYWDTAGGDGGPPDLPNGRPCVGTFRKSGDTAATRWFAEFVGSPYSLTDFTVYVVGRKTATCTWFGEDRVGAIGTVLRCQVPATDGFGTSPLIQYGAASGSGNNAENWRNSDDTTHYPDSANWHRMTFARTAGVTQCWIGNLEQTNRTVTGTPSGQSLRLNTLLRWREHPAGGGDSRSANYLAEIIVFSGYHTPTEQATVWAYLDSRYADGVNYVGAGTGASGDLLHGKDTSGAVFTNLDSINALCLGWAGPSAGARCEIRSIGQTEVPLRLRGVASQSADLQQWQDSAGGSIAKLDSAFTFFARKLDIGKSDDTTNVEIVFERATGTKPRFVYDKTNNRFEMDFDGATEAGTADPTFSAAEVRVPKLVLLPTAGSGIISSEVISLGGNVAFDFQDTINRTAGILWRVVDLANSRTVMDILPGGNLGFGFKPLGTNIGSVGSVLNFLQLDGDQFGATANAGGQLNAGVQGIIRHNASGAGTGNVVVTIDTNTVTAFGGAGTTFLTQLAVGQRIRITDTGEERTITAITDNFNLTVNAVWDVSDASSAFTFATEIAAHVGLIGGSNNSSSVGWNAQMASGVAGFAATTIATATDVGGFVHAGLRGRFTGAGENAAGAKFKDHPIASRAQIAQGNYEHITGLWVDYPAVNNNIGTIPANRPVMTSAARLPISPFAYNTTPGNGATAAGCAWGIWGEDPDFAISGAGVPLLIPTNSRLIPKTVGYMRVPFPRRTEGTNGIYATQFWCEPWASTNAIRGRGEGATTMATPVAGTGTVSVTAATTVVTGVGTAFKTQLAPGMFITIGGETRQIRWITNDRSLELRTAHTAGAAGVAWTFQHILQQGRVYFDDGTNFRAGLHEDTGQFWTKLVQARQPGFYTREQTGQASQAKALILDTASLEKTFDPASTSLDEVAYLVEELAETVGELARFVGLQGE